MAAPAPATAAAPPVIRARGLTKEFGETTVLDRVDLDVAPGDAVAVVGPSGSGKSTLMAVIGLLTTRDGGSLQVDGHHVGASAAALRSARRRGVVSWVPQAPVFLPGRTVFENAVLPVRLGGRTGPADIERIDALLAATELAPIRDRNASVLSGGELQRMAVVRALGSGAPVVLADEPTASLDSENTARVIEALVQNRGSTSVVVATHDERVARACARVVRLTDGRIDGPQVLP